MRAKLLQLKQQSLAQWNIFNVLAVFAFSFVLSNARVLGSFSPFGLSVCMAVPMPFTIFSFLGSLLGYLLLGGIGQNAAYVAALILCTAIKIAFSPQNKSNHALFLFGGIVATASLFVINLCYVIILSTNAATIVLKLTESLLCGCMTYMSCTVMSAVLSKKTNFNLIERTSISILSIVLLMSLAGVEFRGMNLARIIGIACILVGMYRFGYTGGAVTGILFTVAMVLYKPAFAVSAGSLIISGFLAGIFKPFGKVGQVAIFISANTFIAIMMSTNEVSIENMLEILVASLIFLLIPERLYHRFVKTPTAVQSSQNDMAVCGQLACKLEFTSKTLLDLQNSIQEVSNRMEEISSNDIFAVYTKTCDQLCKDCGLNTFCWVTAYNDIASALNSATTLLRNHGKLTRETSPFFFRQKCCQLDQFLQSVNHNYKDYLARENAARRISEARLVAIEQFEGIANMLREMSTELSEVSTFDSKASMIVKEVFEQNGYQITEACCIIDQYGRMCIEIYMESNKQEPTQKDIAYLCNQLSDQLDRDMELPSRMQSDGKMKICFFEHANLSVDFHSCQVSNNNNKYCGDSFEYFMDSKGFAHMILSDGMGSGSHAALDSTMTCSIIHQLIKAGFGFESAFKLINLSFLVKSREESLATLDVCTVDLYTGKAEFIKAGAAVSFVLRNNHVYKVESNSLPIGIIQGIHFDRRDLKLSSGDIVVLVSDGALATGDDWIGAEVELHKSKSAKELSEKLCEQARLRRIDGHSDDVTVLVAKIKKAG